MTPTPPQPQKPSQAPPRTQIPVTPVPCEFVVENAGETPDGQKAYRLTFHTPDTSLTTFWTQQALDKLGRYCQEAAADKPKIEPADLADLRALRDASPFEDT